MKKSNVQNHPRHPRHLDKMTKNCVLGAYNAVFFVKGKSDTLDNP
jgi:hypothetical protein